MDLISILCAVAFFLGLAVAIVYVVKGFIKGPDRYRIASEDARSARRPEASFSPAEKKKLQAMIDRQSKEQEKKQQNHYRGDGHYTPRPSSGSSSRMPALKTSQHHMDAWQRVKHVEEKDRQAKKHSEAKRIHLTEQEKEELREKFPEQARKHSELKGKNLTEEEKEELRKKIRESFS
jgi:hypothetical protein